MLASGDVNAHFGTPSEDIELMPWIGPAGAGPENNQGVAFRESVLACKLAVVNSHEGRDSGPTQIGPRHSHRLDVWCVDEGLDQTAQKAIADKRLAARWAFGKNIDHIPLRLRVGLQLPATTQDASLFTPWGTEKLVTALKDIELRYPVLDEMHQWAMENEQVLQDLRSRNTVAAFEEHWALLSAQLRQTAQTHFLRDERIRKNFVSPTLLTLSDEKAMVLEQLHTQGLPICGVRHLRSWFRMWKIKVRAAKLTRRTRQRAHHDQKVFNQQIIADISISLEHEDPAEAWRLTRRLAGNNRGSRKRRYVAPLSAPAEKEDWDQYLSSRENKWN